MICIDNLLYGQKSVFKEISKKKKNFQFFNIDLRNSAKLDKFLNKASNVLILAGLVGDPITKNIKIIAIN